MLCDKIKYIYNKTFEKSVFRRKVNNMWPLCALKNKKEKKSDYSNIKYFMK